MLESPVVDHEEAGVDPVIGQQRLLDEALDPAGLVPLDRPVGRGQGTAVTVTAPPWEWWKSISARQVDGTETVAVGGHEGAAEDERAHPMMRPAVPVSSPVSTTSTCHASGRSWAKAVDQIGPVAGRKNEIGEALPGVDPHQMEQDRRIAHRHERLGHLEAVRIGPRPLAATENQCLHRRFIVRADLRWWASETTWGCSARLRSIQNGAGSPT